MKRHIHDCIIAVTDNDMAILLKSEPNLIEENVFDGHYLEDNLSDTKNIPKEAGIYKCKIISSGAFYYTDCGNEYDMSVVMEDVEKIFSI